MKLMNESQFVKRQDKKQRHPRSTHYEIKIMVMTRMDIDVGIKLKDKIIIA